MARLLAAFLIILALPLSANAETQSSPFYKRVTLVVADMERALTIYRDILGYSVDGISTSSPESYSYPVFNIPAEATIRFATLSARPDQIRAMALTEVTGIELPRPAAAPHLTASVIRIGDIEAAFRKVIALGLETEEPRFIEGDEFDFWERSFIDYDGHLIVLYQIVDEASD